MSNQGTVGYGPGTTVGPAKALLAHGSSPGPPGLRLVHRPGSRRAGYAGLLKPTVATRRLNYSLVGLERLRATDHHARINPALPDGPLTKTRSSDRSYCYAPYLVSVPLCRQPSDPLKF